MHLDVGTPNAKETYDDNVKQTGGSMNKMILSALLVLPFTATTLASNPSLAAGKTVKICANGKPANANGICVLDPSLEFSPNFKVSVTPDGSAVLITGNATSSGASDPKKVSPTRAIFKNSSADFSSQCLAKANDARDAGASFQLIGFVPEQQEASTNLTFVTVIGCN